MISTPKGKYKIKIQICCQELLKKRIFLIQFIGCGITDPSFLEHPLFLEQVQKNPVRVVLNDDSENPKVAWYFMHEGHLYELEKPMAGSILEATPVKNSELKPPLIDENQLQDTYEEMLDSARDYLADPILIQDEIDKRLIRPADESEFMVLGVAETTEQKKKKWWKGLYEKYLEDVKMHLSDIVLQQFTRKEQIIVLKKFLREHYQFIQGTCLDYVTTPNCILSPIVNTK